VSFQSDLITVLTGNVGLHALVADRIWPDKAPQKPTLPYVILFELQSRDQQAFSNAVVIGRQVFRFVINADTYGSGVDVGAALWTALVGSGYAIIAEDERSDTNAMTGIHRRDLDVRISYVP
jgi:hypothetical protein